MLLRFPIIAIACIALVVRFSASATNFSRFEALLGCCSDSMEALVWIRQQAGALDAAQERQHAHFWLLFRSPVK